MAWEAVDRMWLEIGVDWIAQQRHLSGRQRRLVDEARKYYQALIEEMDLRDDSARAKVATALRRVARIHQHEEEYPEAVDAINRAIAIWRELNDSTNHDRASRVVLRDGLLMKAKLHNLLRQYDDALSSFDELLALATPTAAPPDAASPESDEYLASVRLAMLLATAQIMAPSG